MIILGIYEGHNASACLMVDGKIVAAVSEERFTRIKNDVGYPLQAVNYCLSFAGIEPEQVNYVAVATVNMNLIWTMIKREAVFTVDDYVFEQHNYFKPILIEKKDPAKVLWNYIKKVEARKGVQKTYYDFTGLNKDNLLNLDLYKQIRISAIVNHLHIDPDRIRFIDHHKCHQYYAYYSSPFREDTLILTADGVGDWGINATVTIAKKNRLTAIAKSTNCQIARIYRYITLLLGMKPLDHEYKVMGLAPYANEKEVDRAYRVFESVLTVRGLRFFWKNRPQDLYFHFIRELEGCRFDGIAGALQKFTERILVTWATNAVKQTDLSTVVFAGGVAMNIKLNMAMAEIEGVEKFFVGPSPADESNCMGACYVVMDEICDRQNYPKDGLQPLQHAYLGPDIDVKSVLALVRTSAVTKDFVVKKRVNHSYIARRLQQGKVIGICRGRGEFGARALGNRSILADPSKPETVRRINEQIKFRDFWMPFTPSLLQDRQNDYLVNPKKLVLPYMTVGLKTKPLAAKQLIASLHPGDLTARPQVVSKNTNPLYYDLIREFEKLTGIGGVLNTSLNLHGHPIVNTVEDALFTLKNSNLDAMYFGNVLLERR